MNTTMIPTSSLGSKSISSQALSVGGTILAGGLVLLLTVGCSTKNYVRSQTTPIIQQTNELDTKTATDHRNIQDTDTRAQKGIAGAQSAADTADQHAMAAGQSADAGAKRSRSRRRCTLPASVRGKSDRNSIRRGRLNEARPSPQ